MVHHSCAGRERPISALAVVDSRSVDRCSVSGGEPLAGGPRIGTFLDGAQWDGSDFFLADNNNSIFVVGSTGERIQQLRLSNVAIESASLEPLSTD
jgi:hypothetical protein